jgi:hypothetical protein
MGPGRFRPLGEGLGKVWGRFGDGLGTPGRRVRMMPVTGALRYPRSCRPGNRVERDRRPTTPSPCSSPPLRLLDAGWDRSHLRTASPRGPQEGGQGQNREGDDTPPPNPIAAMQRSSLPMRPRRDDRVRQCPDLDVRSSATCRAVARFGASKRSVAGRTNNLTNVRPRHPRRLRLMAFLLAASVIGCSSRAGCCSTGR